MSGLGTLQHHFRQVAVTVDILKSRPAQVPAEPCPQGEECTLQVAGPPAPDGCAQPPFSSPELCQEEVPRKP